MITGNTDWTITGNSFYQTASRTLDASSGAISIANPTNGNNFMVSNNFIGGDSPVAAVSSIPMTYTGTGTFQGISLNVATTIASSVQGNTIRNISFSTGGSSLYNAGIILAGGAINCGNITPNSIGSNLTSNSIAFVNVSILGGAMGFSGILAGTTIPGIINITNNVICGITASASASGKIDLSGIYLMGGAGTYTVSGNTIGSTTLANAISNSTSQALSGISCASTAGTLSMTNNIISNLSHTNTGVSTNQLFGINKINTSTTPATISLNTIMNLTSSSGMATDGSTAALIGIHNGGTGTVTNTLNTIHSLSSIASAAASKIIGIYSTAPGTISKNNIHSLSLSSTVTTGGMTGIYAGGTSTYANNMIRLGIDATGQISIRVTPSTVFMTVQVPITITLIVYISAGAAVTGTTSPTYAFNSLTTGTRIFQNNIFMNARSGGSNLGAGINHYAIKMAGTTFNPAGLTSGYNLLYAPGTGGMIGYYNLVDYTTLSGLQGATGQDLTSGVGDPSFIAPTGTSATVNLHVNTATPIEAAGLVGSVTDDFDGQVRSTLTPTDIGADAGTFTSSSDVFSPVISFTALGNTALISNRILTAFATITDNVGVSASPNAPRIYYKKSTDANAFAGNTSGDNGWKYTAATNTASPYNFVIDYSILNGGGVVANDIIQYFVVAQDDANNLMSKLAGAGASANPPVQNINAAPSGTINSYTILASISGTYTVGGVGANFTTLTAADGAFAAINASSGSPKVTGNITIVMTGNTTEPGTVALNQWVEEPAGSNFTVTIRPDAATMRTATGSLATPLFRLDGADRVTIDGRFGGSGRYLTFVNSYTTTAATSATLSFANGATGNTVQYCSIQGGNTNSASGVVFFGTTTAATGNNNNVISNCEIKDIGGTTRTANMICNTGSTTTALKNIANSILNNEISNFENCAVKLTNSGTQNSPTSSAVDWVISGNSMFYNKAQLSVAAMRPLEISAINTLISGNYIGGQAPLCGGSALTSASFSAIYNNSNGLTSIQGNTIQNLVINGGAAQIKLIYGYSITPINIGNITGNLFGHPSNPNSIIINTTSGYNHVIYFQTSGANVMNNTIANIVFNPGTGANNAVIEMNYGGPNVISNNVIHDIFSSSTAGTIDATAALTGISAPYSPTGITIENNTIYNLSTTNVASTAAITVQGIYVEASYTVTPAANILRNNIYNLTTSNTGGNANIYGIHARAGTHNFYNNLISLGTGVTGPVNINGIFSESGTSNWYFNSVNIVGTASSGANTSNAFYRTGATATLKDNILVNSRSGGTGVHCAIRVNPVTGTFVSDYNDLFATGTTLGFWGAAAQANLAAWKLSSGKDAASVSVDPQFVSATDLHTIKTELNNGGVAVAGITVDFANVTRTNPPDG